MAATINEIKVPLPAGVHPTTEDIELLERLFSAVATVRLEPKHEWPAIRDSLLRNGWNIRWGLQWHVEAHRERELEEACGGTLDEAFGKLWQVTREDQALEGTP